MDSVQLTESDIEGAALDGRNPRQLTIEQLRFWLSCRGVKPGKLKSKAELVARTQGLIDSNLHVNVVDPTDGQLYKKRKLKDQDQDASPNKDQDTVVSDGDSIRVPSTGWTRDLPHGLDFDDVHIHKYSLNSGKRAAKISTQSMATKKTCIRPETRGYQFFSEQYLHEVYCQESTHLFFKCKCFASQKKNDVPHQLWCALDKKLSYDVVQAHCTCIAGESAYCNHVMALLYQIRDYSMKQTKCIPDDRSKTSLPQAWHKPRIEGISADPVMQCAINNKAAEKGGLYEARTEHTISNDNAMLASVQLQLRNENPLYGFTYMASCDNNNTTYCRTRLSSFVPKGSVLSYQLALSEGNFNVECDHASLARFRCKDSCIIRDVTYPTFPLYDINRSTQGYVAPSTPFDSVLKSLCVDTVRATAVEVQTREQAASSVWWDERKKRLTASVFAEICTRKKSDCTKFVARLQRAPSSASGNMPNALKHGKEYEPVAIRKYMRYMSNIGHKVVIEQSGLVLCTDIPYLGCSPDGKVIDPVCHPHFGILEVKCPYSYRGITPKEAANIDSSFCLEYSGTPSPKLNLKKSHHYYFQVQGQMAITGAQWCDFIVYTFKGLQRVYTFKGVQRVPFDRTFWDTMLVKLEKFFFASYLPKLQ